MNAGKAPRAGRVVLLSYYAVNEASSGGTRRVSELLKALGPDHALLIQPRDKHPACETHPYAMDFGRHRAGINWGIFNFFWPATARRVRRWIEDAVPRTIILCSIWAWAPFRAKRPDCPVILDAQNVDAVAIAERFGWRHPFTRLVHYWEKKVAGAVDRIIVCSEVDRDLFKSIYGIPGDKLYVVPNGADIPSDDMLQGECSDTITGSFPRDVKVLLYVAGKMNYPPNAEGFDFLRHQLMPRLESASPGAYKLIVIGSPAPAGTMPPNVICTGRVPDVAPYLRRADICLAPIQSGSGTRLKVLEYLAWAKPVISTAKGAEGIACVDGEHLLIRKTEEFADAIRTLINDRSLAGSLGRKARGLMMQQYAWTSSHTRWRRAIVQ